MPTTIRAALIGATGQLGRDLERVATARGWELLPLAHDEIEIADAASVERALDAARPALVINTAACQGAAAYGAEDQAAFFRVNALGPWHLARWCGANGAALVHYSTDYVFGSGATARPLAENDAPAPQNVYGASKLAGEQLVRATLPRHWLLRVASLYGAGGCRAKGGSNFVDGVLDRAGRGEPLEIVDDQLMSPTSTADVARTTVELVERGAPHGLYHCAGSGACSWYELAREALRVAGIDAELRPTTTPDDPPGAAFVRPRRTPLDNAALRAAGLPDLPPWREALAAHVAARLERQPVESYA